MKKQVYLDSTIPSYLFDERPGIRAFVEITKNWWQEERSDFDLWTSQAGVVELGRGDYPNKSEVMGCLSQIRILPSNDRIAEIVRVYQENHLMPQGLTGDAMHLAYASFYKMDFLLTWNCNHLANGNKRQHIRILNSRLGLFVPEIVTPLELFTESIE